MKVFKCVFLIVLPTSFSGLFTIWEENFRIFEISEDEVITVVIAVWENFLILLSSNVHRKLGRYLKKGKKSGWKRYAVLSQTVLIGRSRRDNVEK